MSRNSRSSTRVSTGVSPNGVNFGWRCLLDTGDEDGGRGQWHESCAEVTPAPTAAHGRPLAPRFRRQAAHRCRSSRCPPRCVAPDRLPWQARRQPRGLVLRAGHPRALEVDPVYCAEEAAEIVTDLMHCLGPAVRLDRAVVDETDEVGKTLGGERHGRAATHAPSTPLVIRRSRTIIIRTDDDATAPLGQPWAHSDNGVARSDAAAAPTAARAE
jgi:hypothetical protein